MNHENIILMYDMFETSTKFCVVMEYAQVSACSSVQHPTCVQPCRNAANLVPLNLLQSDLYRVLLDDRQLPEKEVQDIAKQLLHVRVVRHY